MTDPINQPIDQELSVQDVHFITRRRDVDDPPEVLMVLDVQHEEAGTVWRQQLRFSRQKFVDTLRLAMTLARNEDL